MRSRMSARVVGLGLCLVGGLATTVVAPSVAAPNGDVATAALPAAVAEPADSQPVSSRLVTLVTGDVVRLDTAADGRQTATVVRHSGRSRDYHTYTSHGDVYVEPGSAFGLLAAGRLDPELFNVSGL